MKKPISVAELILLLEKIDDKTKTVFVEGCDCVGEAVSVDPEFDKSSILIERGDSLR
jgi:hypothetical protein